MPIHLVIHLSEEEKQEVQETNSRSGDYYHSMRARELETTIQKGRGKSARPEMGMSLQMQRPEKARGDGSRIQEQEQLLEEGKSCRKRQVQVAPAWDGGFPSDRICSVKGSCWMTGSWGLKCLRRQKKKGDMK